MSAVQPLAGIRVIDLTSVVMGPLGTQMLADLGADVIAIEAALGDANRHMGTGPHPELSGVALNLLRNKRSIVLDLRAEAGYEALLRLVSSADVFVTNLRPGSRARARITRDDLAIARPDLVWCAAAGYPAESERADDAAYDDIIQAAAGLVDVAERSGLPPVLSPTLLVDKVCGMALAQAVTAGLLHRERTGEGSETVLAMYDIIRGFLLVEHGAAAIAEPPQGRSGYPRLLSPERRPLRTSDGLVVILAYERHQFEGLITIGGRVEMLDDPRFRTRLGRLDNIDELYREYQRIADGHTTASFLEACATHGVPASRVESLDSIVEGLPLVEHPVAGTYRHTPPLVGGPAVDAAPRRPAPLLGQHGREVLAEVGYDDERLDALEQAGVLGRYRRES